MRDLNSKIETLRVVAHPVRIMILQELSKGVKCVSDLEDFLEMRQPSVSQHLSTLRKQGLIDFFMDGRLRCYYLKDPVVPDLLNIINKHYEGDLPGPACCPVTKKGKYPGKSEK